MSHIEVTTATAPASWVPYLVSGDSSAMAGDNLADCDNWIDRLARDGWVVVGCEGESEFSWRNDATGARYGADCLVYVLHHVGIYE